MTAEAFIRLPGGPGDGDEPGTAFQVRTHGWIVAIVATVTMLLMVLESHRHLAFQIPVVDAATYHEMARHLAAGEGAGADAFWQPPLYPYVLSGLYRLGITHMLILRLLHGGACVAAALLTWRLASRLLAPRVALAAGLVVALQGPLLFEATQLLPTGLGTVLNLLAVLASLRVHARPTPARAALCGAAFGVAALATPLALAGLLVPLGLSLRRVWTTPPGAARRLAWRPAALLVLGAALCILPVTLRNRVVSGDWVLISTNGGINLYIGNNDDPAVPLRARPGLEWERLVAWPHSQGASSAVEADRFFYREVRAYGREHPFRAVGGLITKTLWLLDGREVPRNVDIYNYRDYSVLLCVLVWSVPGLSVPTGLLMPLALLGLWAFAGRGPAARLVLVHTAVYAAMVVLFFPVSRYRVPLLPLLALPAAAGVAWGWAHWRSGRRRLAPALLLGALVLVNWPRTSPLADIPFAAELHTHLGVGLQVRGQREAALAEYAAALAESPEFADALYYRGTALRDLGRTEEARQSFLAALRAHPTHEKALHDLAVLLYTSGQVEKAAALLRRALEVNPRYVRAMHHLALAEVRLGHHEEATQWLRRARALEPKPPRAAAP